ncbi:Fungalysin metallopeptidase (M36) [Spirosoma fluviale]|uniref:Fungalysin metallopeptidase (M36) n=1 Tax=Spirosoma fluviale TaxID=1597977 RepID=A0A286FFY1_9BACT|nr:Fungalysin metallopeptidase (M36) [Spirosoma fluviale]
MFNFYCCLYNSSRIRYALLLFFLVYSVQLIAQTEVEVARQYVIANVEKQQLTASDVGELLISSAYRSPTTGWYHIYFNQGFQSIEVYNRLMSLALVDQQVASLTHNFIPSMSLMSMEGSLKNRITPQNALLNAITNVGLSATDLAQLQEVSSTRLIEGTPTAFAYIAPALSSEKIAVKLYWLPVEIEEKGRKTVKKLTLTWNVRLLTKDSKNGWNIHVDATSGEVLLKTDEVIHCEFGHGIHALAQNDKHSLSGLASHIPQAAPLLSPMGYTVFDYPLESPNHGSRTESVSPYTRFAPAGTGTGSTNGWHNDGTTDYTTTRGNNVWAQEDVNGNDGVGASPSSPTLAFTYPYTFGLNTAAGNQNASITNLFYWNNLIHDVLWRFGFDEPSGNFQNANQGRGGLGNDYVYADAQDGGGTNNANFYAPTDGNKGRMQMYLWDIPTSYQPDGDLDNGIIAHEYGHGWSIRLTGGPANSSCLNNAEQGGEGWSDYLALMLTTDWASLSATVASANKPRGIGTYALGQSTTGSGIRPYRYSYDMTSVNGSVTYAKVGSTSFSIPHGVGSI